MKRFNPEKEFSKMKNRNVSITNYSGLHTMFLPLFVLVCFGVTLLSTSFAGQFEELREIRTIRISILNGSEDAYIKQVGEGYFEDVIESTSVFSNLSCSKGSLHYDSSTNKISGTITEDVVCVLAFSENSNNSISLENTKMVADNTGISYYFKGYATNNYVLIKNTMFRIVRRNGDGTYRLIAEENFKTSTMEDFSLLEEDLSLFAKDFQEYLRPTDFDVAEYHTLDFTDLLSSQAFFLSSVGLLSVKEAYLVNDGTNTSYLQGNYYLANKSGNTYFRMKGNKLVEELPSTELGIRPVINVEIASVSGKGTKELPYLLQ